MIKNTNTRKLFYFKCKVKCKVKENLKSIKFKKNLHEIHWDFKPMNFLFFEELFML